MKAESRNDVSYQETYRPQFHFTARKGWLNDPNGLVYYRGEYHLFFQHNPFGTEWGNMTWGHAVSRDLVHWEQLPNAIEPDELGTIFSGSAVVDAENTAGLAAGTEKPIVAFYTAAGGTSPQSQGRRFTQCMAYSLDRGRTFRKYPGNPVVGHIAAENRDPKVTRHAPSRQWIMALYLDGNEFALLRSPDLIHWQELQRLTIPECAECPDFFPMTVRGRPNEQKWIFTAANGRYLVGTFDGNRFSPEGPPKQVDFGANFYAVQTYSGIPPSDGRRIQIAWMAGGAYPQMPFNQQMSFPCELTLRPTEDGLRLYRWPVREIRTLYAAEHRATNRPLRAGQEYRIPAKAELWDVEMQIQPASAESIRVMVRGQEIVWERKSATLQCLGRAAPLTLRSGELNLRLLADRTSLEVFAQGGRVSMTSCVLFDPQEREITVCAEGGEARLRSLAARTLRSAWRSR